MSSANGSQGGKGFLEQQLGIADRLRINPVQQDAPELDLRSATLGAPVNRQQDVGRDLQGKYMGWGTNVNANRLLFNTKESVLMIPAWAQALNTLFNNSRPQLQLAASQGIMDFSLGIAGVIPDAPGQVGYYVPGITRYYPDESARLTISALKDQADDIDQRVAPYLLPGSTAARAANAQGFAIGLAYVKSPRDKNNTGYLRVGSKGWRDALSRWSNGTYVANDSDMEHLFGQGAVYGLGPIYRMFGINIEAQADERDPDNFPVRYKLASQVPLKQVIGNSSFMRRIQAHYDAYLKNPDQSRIGKYGAAALLLRHADKMNTTATGAAGDMNSVNTAVLDAWNRNGSVAGVAKWGAGRDNINYADFNNRRGLTANPLRDAAGNPINRQQSIDPRTGDCNIYGSGPGVSQRASLGGEYGFRFVKGTRKHLRTRKGEEGTEIAPKTYYCADTPDFVVNPDRKIYQAGPNGRATQQRSLEQVLAAYGNGYSAQDLRAQYLDWTDNPQRYGTNPWFMLDPNTRRRGFSRAAPKAWADTMNPQEARAFNELNLTRLQKVKRSEDLALQALGTGGVPQHPKTSYPTSGLVRSRVTGGYRVPGAPTTQ